MKSSYFLASLMILLIVGLATAGFMISEQQKAISELSSKPATYAIQDSGLDFSDDVSKLKKESHQLAELIAEQEMITHSKIKNTNKNIKKVQRNSDSDVKELSKKIEKASFSASDFSSTVENPMKGVVKITVKMPVNYSIDRLSSQDDFETITGSGTIVSDSGLILTNKHVVDQSSICNQLRFDGANCVGAAQITVETFDGQTSTSTVLKTSSDKDLALLSSHISGRAITLGNSDDLRVGQPVIIVGSPSFDFTVTQGIVSGVNRNIKILEEAFETSFGNNLWIQTDTAINYGNSGGAMLDKSGALIGIPTIISPNQQGIGFALPINYAKQEFNLR